MFLTSTKIAMPTRSLSVAIIFSAMLAGAVNFQTARAQTSGKASKVNRSQEPIKSYRFAVRGRAVDQNGRPVARAVIVVDAGLSKTWEDFTYSVESDKSGNFLFSDGEQSTPNHVRYLYVTGPLPDKTHNPILPPFNRIPVLTQRRFASRAIQIKENAEINVGDVPIKIEYGSFDVHLRDVDRRSLRLNEQDWRYVWLRVRNEQGRIVRFGSFSIDDIENSVDLANSSARIALPYGKWRIEASLRENKGPWLASGGPIEIGSLNKELNLRLGHSLSYRRAPTTILPDQQNKLHLARSTRPLRNRRIAGLTPVYGLSARRRIPITQTAWSDHSRVGVANSQSSVMMQLQRRVGIPQTESNADNDPIRGQKTSFVTEPNNEDTSPVDYKVWRVFGQDKTGFTVMVVSVKPENFNPGDMKALAIELNKRFHDKPKVKIGLVDNENIARLFAEGRAEYSTYETAERGRYYLDRDARIEYVDFLPIGDSRRHKKRIRPTAIRKTSVLAIEYVGDSNKPIPPIVISDTEPGAEYYQKAVLNLDKWDLVAVHVVDAALLERLIAQAGLFERTAQAKEEEISELEKTVSVTIITAEGKKTFLYGTKSAISYLDSLEEHCTGDESLRSDIVYFQKRIRR